MTGAIESMENQIFFIRAIIFQCAGRVERYTLVFILKNIYENCRINSDLSGIFFTITLNYELFN